MALVAIAVIACGKRGDPHPPVPVIPKATSDLLVTQRGTKVLLTWSYPSLTIAGENLRGIKRVSVYRYVEELPAPPAGAQPNSILPGDIDTTRPRPLALFAKIPPITPAQFGKLSQRIDSIEGASLPAATVGAKLEYDDTPSFHATDGRPVRITYAVVTVGESARSDLSNLVSIVPLDVPAPPTGVKAEATAPGIVLSWTKPEDVTTGDSKPYLIGYDVYRAPAAQPADNLGTTVNTSPVAGTTYTDTPAYGEFRYRVTAVASAGPPRIESDPSEPVTATFKDLVPPQAPANVSALVETHAVRLVWDPVQAPDLAGYKVYRTEGVGHEDIKVAGTIPLTGKLLTVTTYLDPGADLGIAYKYGVSAFDKNGNESATTWTGWVVRSEDSLMTAGSQRWRWALLAAVVALAAFLRFDGLGRPSYWLDEILGDRLTTRAASQPAWRWITGLEREHGPLYYATQLATRLAGRDEAAGRLAAALFGLAAIPMVWFAAGLTNERSNRRPGDERDDLPLPLVSSLLMAVSPLHVYYSREARPYALVILLTAALLIVLMRARSIAAASLVLLAMLYTSAVAAPVVAAAALTSAVAAFVTPEREERRYLWMVAAMATATTLLFAALYRGTPSPAASSAFPRSAAGVIDQVCRALTVSAIGAQEHGRTAIAMVVLAIIGAAGIALYNRRAAVIVIGMTVLPALFATVSLRLLGHWFAVRYISPALVGFIVLVAAGVAGIAKLATAPLRNARVARMSSIAIALALTAGIGTETWAAARSEPLQKLDWRSIGIALERRVRPGDVIVTADAWSDVSLRYYLRSLSPGVRVANIDSAEGAQLVAATAPSSWFVSCGVVDPTPARNWSCFLPCLLATRLEGVRINYSPAVRRFVSSRSTLGDQRAMAASLGAQGFTLHSGVDDGSLLDGESWGTPEGTPGQQLPMGHRNRSFDLDSANRQARSDRSHRGGAGHARRDAAAADVRDSQRHRDRCSRDGGRITRVRLRCTRVGVARRLEHSVVRVRSHDHACCHRSVLDRSSGSGGELSADLGCRSGSFRSRWSRTSSADDRACVGRSSRRQRR